MKLYRNIKKKHQYTRDQIKEAEKILKKEKKIINRNILILKKSRGLFLKLFMMTLLIF